MQCHCNPLHLDLYMWAVDSEMCWTSRARACTWQMCLNMNLPCVGSYLSIGAAMISMQRGSSMSTATCAPSSHPGQHPTDHCVKPAQHAKRWSSVTMAPLQHFCLVWSLTLCVSTFLFAVNTAIVWEWTYNQPGWLEKM